MAERASQSDRTPVAQRSSKDHWFPFFPRDFFADGHVQLMDADAEGCYLRLLAFQWLEGAIPGDVKAAAKLCPKVSPARFRKIWQQVSPCFPVDCGDGTRQNRKLERIREERQSFLAKKSDAGKKGNEARWKHRKPVADGSQTDRKAIANASPPPPLPKVSGGGHQEITDSAAAPPPDGGARPEPARTSARVREEYLTAAGRSGVSAFQQDVAEMRQRLKAGGQA